MGSDSGQASSDYIAILLVCACVLGAGGAVASAAGARGLAGAVSAQMARAICRVTGGDCERDRLPCVTSVHARIDDLAGVVAIIRLSGGRTLLRERRSDGMELVTLAERGGLGLEVGAGAEAGMGGGAVGDSVAGSISGRVTRGRAWLRRAGPEAQALVDNIKAPPPPDYTWGEKGMESRAEGRYRVAGLSLDAEDTIAGGIKTRFKYRSVPAADYGLAPEEVLSLGDSDLNAIVGLRRVSAPYRDDAGLVRPNVGKMLELGVGAWGGVGRHNSVAKRKREEREERESRRQPREGAPSPASRRSQPRRNCNRDPIHQSIHHFA